MNNAHKEILDNFFGMILEDSINDNMMEFSYKFPYDGMKEYALEICGIPFHVFLEYINKYQENDVISADCVSQFSKLDDCLLGFCEATNNMRRPLTFEEIGERLQDDGVYRNSVANIKYGENHSKMALQFGLAQCRYNYWYISALGKVFSQLPKEKQDALMIRTLLRNKLYALIFTRLQNHDVSIENILRNVNLSDSTRTRRLSSVKRILTWYFGALHKENVVYQHKIIELPLSSIRYLHLPINVQRRFAVAMPKQRKDLRNFISLSASEKDYHTYSDLYLEQILRIPYLTKADENKYFEQYLKGNENAKDAIVESYLPTIYNIAKKYVAQSPDIDIQDLIGEGVYALCKAIPYYDPSSPARLITFAIHGIRGAMYEYVLHNRIVHLPSNQIISLKKIQAAYDRFEQENERRPSAEELAWVLNESVYRVADTLKMSGESVSLEGYEDHICAENEDSPFYNLYRESFINESDRALATLTPREADILRKYYGIGVKEKTLEELGIELHLTQERVRQIRDKAIRRLKSSSRSRILKTYLGEENFYDGISLSSDPHVKQTKQTAEPVQNFEQEQSVHVIQSAEDIRNQRKQEKIKQKVKGIEERIAQIIRPRLNELTIPEEENKKYNYYNRLVSETRKIFEQLNEWGVLKKQYSSLEMINIEGNGNILSHIERNICILDKSSYTSERTLVDLKNHLSRYSLLSQITDNEPLIYCEETVLELYTKLILNMNRAKIRGELAPHKPVLLLAIMDVVEDYIQQGDIETILNQPIPFRPLLESKFIEEWHRHVRSENFKENFRTPIVHMQNEPFYQLIKRGKYKQTYVSTIETIEYYFKGIGIDDKLLLLMIDSNARVELRKLLIELITENKLIY